MPAQVVVLLMTTRPRQGKSGCKNVPHVKLSSMTEGRNAQSLRVFAFNVPPASQGRFDIDQLCPDPDIDESLCLK